jgi:four helix bundle protein
MKGGDEMLSGFEAYQLALRLYRRGRGIHCPGYVRDHLQRACLSVVLNLAEGSAKPTPKERQRFYAIALGSLREVQAALDLSDQTEEIKTLADRVGAMLYRLHRPR